MGTIVFKGGRALDVPFRYRFVLNQLMKKMHAGTSARQSSLRYDAVSVWFEWGKLEEDINSTGLKLQEKDKRERLKLRMADPKWDATTVAMEFSRQFRRWLRDRGVDPNAVVKCDRCNQSYALGNGWAANRMVLGQSEATRVCRSDTSMEASSQKEAFDSWQQSESDSHDDHDQSAEE